MKLTKLKSVETYSGYRHSQRPLNFFKEKRVDVIEIVKTALIRDVSSPKDTRKLFVVKGSDNTVYRLYYSIESDEWFVES